MASFEAKIGWKMPRKIKNKNYRSVPFLHKNTKKLKNTFIASCLAKIGLKRPRKRENNNYRSVPFLPNAK